MALGMGGAETGAVVVNDLSVAAWLDGALEQRAATSEFDPCPAPFLRVDQQDTGVSIGADSGSAVCGWFRWWRR
jgi:hypothetical protein